MKITRRQLSKLINESLVLENDTSATGMPGRLVVTGDRLDPNDPETKKSRKRIEDAYSKFYEKERIGSRADEADIPDYYFGKGGLSEEAAENSYCKAVQMRFLEYLQNTGFFSGESAPIKEALGDRGDLPQKKQYQVGMRPEDLPMGSVTGTGYADINDPYNPDANPEAVMFDMPDEPEMDTLAPGEQFKIMSFDLDLVDYIGDSTMLRSILDKVKALGGIVMVMPDDVGGMVLEFQSSREKLLQLASHIHNLGGGDSFNAEEFAEYELMEPSMISPEFN